MSNFANLIMQHTGLPAAIEQGEETILLNNGKACYKNDWANSYQMNHPSRPSLDDLKQWQNGFGRLLYPYSNGDIKMVRDLDFEPQVSQILVDYFLTEPVIADNACIIKTASGKYHLHFRVSGGKPKNTHEFSLQWKFPNDFPIKEYREKPFGKKIEDFWEKHQMAFNEDEKGYHVYEKSKIKDITQLPTIGYYELMDAFEKVLLYNCFTIDTSSLVSEDIEKETGVGFVGNSKTRKIPSYMIGYFADFIIEILEANDGAKHRIILALGSYLANTAKVEKDSAIQVIEKIIEKRPELFKSNDDALKTLLKGYDSDSTKHHTGATSIYDEYASSLMSAEEYWLKMFFYTGALTKIYPTKMNGMKFDCILFNPYTKQVEHQKIRISTKKGEEGNHIIDSTRAVFGFQIVAIERIENPIITSANDKFRLIYIPSGSNRIKVIEGSTMKEILDKLTEQIGIVLGSEYRYVFNQIVSLFTRNNLIATDTVSPIPGVFEIDGELRRFDYNLKEVKPVVNKKKLVNAVELLCEIRDVFPTETNKFGAIIRAGLLTACVHVLKEHGHMARYIVLVGDGKTLKTTIAELLVNLWNPTRKSSKDGNIYSAGSFASEYQVGIKFGISSYPLVVNECAKAFQEEQIVEILKSAIESNIARSTADGTYYSLSTIIFTSNPDITKSDAMIRRSQLFYFTPTDRATESDIEKIAELLNRKGVNDRFKELNEIGQFVFTFLHDNLHLLDELSTEELEFRLVDEIEKETEIDLDWLKQEDGKEDNNVIIEEMDNEVLAEFLAEIKSIYNFNFRNLHNYDYEDDDGMHYKTLLFSDSNLVSLIIRGVIPFLAYDQNEDKIFIIGNRVKDFFHKKYQKVVTINHLYEQLEDFSAHYDVFKSRMRIEGKNYRGIRCSIELIIDLMNNDIDEDNDVDNNQGLSLEEEQLLQRLLAKREAAKEDLDE